MPCKQSWYSLQPYTDWSCLTVAHQFRNNPDIIDTSCCQRVVFPFSMHSPIHSPFSFLFSKACTTPYLSGLSLSKVNEEHCRLCQKLSKDLSLIIIDLIWHCTWTENSGTNNFEGVSRLRMMKLHFSCVGQLIDAVMATLVARVFPTSAFRVCFPSPNLLQIFTCGRSHLRYSSLWDFIRSEL